MNMPADNILQFATALNLRLHPVQRIILKVMYGLELDNLHTFEVLKPIDWEGEGKFNIQTFTEASYLQHLYDCGRSNVSTPTDGPCVEFLGVWGRRAGKSMLISLLASYESYKLLLKEDPHAYYGIPRGSEIQAVVVETDKDQASLMFDEIDSYVETVNYLNFRKTNSTQTYTKFQTDANIDQYGRYANNPTAKAMFKLAVRSAVTKGLRGSGNIVVILDEMAHFSADGRAIDQEVYNALVPSLVTFTKKDDRGNPVGPVESRMIGISSPNGKQGFFYQKCSPLLAKRGPNYGRVCMQIPAWEMNPHLPVGELLRQANLDMKTFRAEYGAEFLDLDNCPHCGHAL